MSVTRFDTRTPGRRLPTDRIGRRAATRSRAAARRSRLLVALGILAFGSAAGPAGAAALLDVRIGKHEGYTRIVLDLDEGVKHQIDRIETGRGSVFLVTLNATAARRVIAPDAPLLSVVRIEPRDGETIVRVAATSSDVDVNVFPLRDPNRLVLDLRSGKAAAPKAAATPRPTPPPRDTVEAPRPTARAEAPKPAPAPREPTPAPAPTVAPTREAAKARPSAVAPTEKPAEPTAPAAQPAELAEKPAVAPSEAPAEQKPATEAPGAPAPALQPPPQVRPADRRRAAVERGERARVQPPAEPAPAEPTGISPLLLAAAVLAVLLIAGAIWMRRRRGGELEASSEFFPPESDEGIQVGSAAETMPGGGLDSVGMPIPPPKDEEEDLPVVPGTQPRMPAAARPAASDSLARDVDRRIQGLETRLAEVVDARDRLERQVSAQAEELRVQRAAIARAQRVLRTLARPEEATEPAPRDPNRGPSR
ncbi:MAG: hypothetical protein JSU66_06495 [Deltaproteobacteria bacterium]|nr:MAG: hypothetical protein JSU66_06495 [Deltaproteobacteria bacterium]